MCSGVSRSQNDIWVVLWYFTHKLILKRINSCIRWWLYLGGRENSKGEISVWENKKATSAIERNWYGENNHLIDHLHVIKLFCYRVWMENKNFIVWNVAGKHWKYLIRGNFGTWTISWQVVRYGYATMISQSSSKTKFGSFIRSVQPKLLKNHDLERIVFHK